MTDSYDAILIVSFGGPEKPDDVMPFLENVVRGKPVPRERLLEVAEHYYHFGGVSPINQQVREFNAALRQDLDSNGCHLPIYWGNRNWHPLLADTLRQMRDDGITRAIAYVTSPFSSYSSCRQYRENVERARLEVGDGAPVVDKLRTFHNHPGFISASADRIGEVTGAARQTTPADDRKNEYLLFTAHSIPHSMSANCRYVEQLNEACQLVVTELGWPADRWKLTYQSRSGRPGDPWLEPDVCDVARELSANNVKGIVVAPIGFVSDHIEVLFDLDDELQKLCQEVGLTYSRAKTVGTHPKMVETVRLLLEERLNGAPRLCLGSNGPAHDVCPVDCCQYTPAGRPSR